MKFYGRRDGLVYIGLLATIGTTQAFASTVSIVGGFSGYVGPVGGCGQFTTTINGQNVTPASGCDPSTFSAQLSETFPTTSSVEFFERSFGDTTDETHNLVAFQPASQQNVAKPGDEFLLGTLTFTNGIWFGTGAAVFFPFSLTTVSTDPALNGKTFNDFLTLYITPNDFSVQGMAAAKANADFLYFTDLVILGSTRVDELPDGFGNTGTFDVYGAIDDLVPTRFANPQGSGFIDPGIGAAPTSDVPEPGTAILFGLGLAGVFGRRAVRLRRIVRRAGILGDGSVQA